MTSKLTDEKGVAAMDWELRVGNENGYQSDVQCLVCGHTEDDHDMRFDWACWHGGGMCDCSMFEAKAG